MSKIPLYVCNRKKCLICKGTICGRAIGKDYAEVDENGDPGGTWTKFLEVEK